MGYTGGFQPNPHIQMKFCQGEALSYFEQLHYDYATALRLLGYEPYPEKFIRLTWDLRFYVKRKEWQGFSIDKIKWYDLGFLQTNNWDNMKWHSFMSMPSKDDLMDAIAVGSQEMWDTLKRRVDNQRPSVI